VNPLDPFFCYSQELLLQMFHRSTFNIGKTMPF
jgi:hypothetical protein